MDWKIKFDQEIEMAILARQHGNEGQARVCARRAAGAAIREYFMRRGDPVRTASAYDLLQKISTEARLPEVLRQAADLLTLRVGPDFTLPAEADLLQAARSLAQGLLPGPD
jgi:HEPN domain-containing protein